MKPSLIFYEIFNLTVQNAIDITLRGSTTEMSIITARRVFFSNFNWYPTFYMPYWPSYGSLLYIENYGVGLTINNARTDMPNDLGLPTNSIALFINDLNKWKFTAIMSANDFYNAIKP